ncbi:hypothetical protein TI01_0950 [Lysobacter sp. A03]|nr:hypothetical protein TI01_0950 [Lysobacter sp. A03]
MASAGGCSSSARNASTGPACGPIAAVGPAMAGEGRAGGFIAVFHIDLED